MYRSDATPALMLRLVAMVAVVLASGAACRRAADAPVDVSEASGADASAVTERVISIVPNVTEQLWAIGAGSSMVARSYDCNYPEQAQALPSIGSGLSPDIEAMLALEPTLVVASEVQRALPALTVLRDAGVDVLVVPDARLEDAAASLRVLGERLHRRASAEAAAAALESGLAQVARATADVPRVPALVLVGRDPPYAAGPDSRLGELLELAGGQNVVEGGDWVQLDLEALIALAPQVVIEPDGAGDATWWDAWDQIPAVASGRLCQIDADALSRSGPRLADAAVAIVRCLHPALALDAGLPAQ